MLMQRCIQLAAQGLGQVSPNPMVGCVIVANDTIIGEGYHKKFGGPHAEVEAIRNVKDKGMLKRATLFVNLEPCSHHGKTPPCADLIIRSGIPEVVIGMTDPNVLVAGKGISMLREAGIVVREGLLEKESRILNQRFIVNQEQRRPYIILKWAQSEDGFMDIDRSHGVKGIHWITGEASKRLVHFWRSGEDAVMIGANTVCNDNPMLTVRELSGRQPIRVVLDPQCRLHENYNVFNNDAHTIVINEIKNEKKTSHLEYVQVPDMNNNLSSVARKLFELNVGSVLIEGGYYTLQKWLDSGLYDEIRVLRGGDKMHQGQKAPEIQWTPVSQFENGEDRVYIYSGFKSSMK
jgi:diaminohydroxyphosphoribosylaminopyrimidine deaminase / 5-amino-6-(5-phosphoribosylamino)uracil reductase